MSKLENFQYYFFLVCTTILLLDLSKNILDADEIILNSLVDKLTKDQIQEAIVFQKKWSILSYIIIPLILLLKVSIISGVLDMGCFLFKNKIKFKKLFLIVIKAEFVFLLVIISKTTWFYLFKTDYNLEDLQYFYPLSAINITGYENLDPWWVYPLQVLNLFELAYWLILAYLLGKELKVKFDKGMSIVASSYGVALAIWVVGVMFFTLNMS